MRALALEGDRLVACDVPRPVPGRDECMVRVRVSGICGTDLHVLDRPVDDWLDLATVHHGLHLAELTPPVLVESCRLPPPFHGDPADQIIVATTRTESLACHLQILMFEG